MVDLRIAHSKELYDSVYAANNFLSEQLYSKINGLDAVISFIGHIVQNDGCNEVSVGQLRFYMLLFLEVLDLKTGSVYGNFV